jgi:hypothetical protein
MKYIGFIILFSLFPKVVFCQNKMQVININAQYIPKDIKYKGKVVNAVRWKDNLGDHFVVTTETGSFYNEASKEPDSNDAEIYAYHYLIKDKITTQIWEMTDFERDCILDVYAGYIKKTFQITDLNSNGVPEIWLMYKTICAGDVSPYTMKIILFEGTKKYTIRGRNKVKTADDEYLGGEYGLDKQFYRAPKQFKDFAKNLWEKNMSN